MIYFDALESLIVTYLICVISYGNEVLHKSIVIGGLVNVLISRHKGVYLSDWLLATWNNLIIEITWPQK